MIDNACGVSCPICKVPRGVNCRVHQATHWERIKRAWDAEDNEQNAIHQMEYEGGVPQ